MEKPKKYSIEEKQDVVQEPITEYKSKSETISEDELSGLLEKLIKKGIAQCERGETTPHEVVMARIKKKYNLPL
jgi:vacuolar-type H+-ATPase subunit E/Vma4